MRLFDIVLKLIVIVLLQLFIFLDFLLYFVLLLRLDGPVIEFLHCFLLDSQVVHALREINFLKLGWLSLHSHNLVNGLR
jgi:hypothetical protein